MQEASPNLSGMHLPRMTPYFGITACDTIHVEAINGLSARFPDREKIAGVSGDTGTGWSRVSRHIGKIPKKTGARARNTPFGSWREALTCS